MWAGQETRLKMCDEHPKDPLAALAKALACLRILICVDRNTSHVIFSQKPCTCDHTHIVAQGVSVRISLHPHAIHDVTCLSVRLLSLRVCLTLVSLSLLLLLFHCLLVLCPAHHLQCRHRRGLKPLHSSTTRCIAPWRCTILSQVMSPSSGTIHCIRW